jgi:hypothetical protein
MEQKSTIPERGFNAPKQLQNWLNSLSEEQTVIFARIIASRAAQRVLPNINKVFELESDTTNLQFDFTLTTLRCNTISRVAALCAIRKIGGNLRDAVFLAGSAASSVASATDSAAFSAAAASSALSAFPSAGAAGSADSAARSAASAFSAADSALSAADLVAIWDARFTAVWAAVTADARALEAGATPEEMATRPLWPEGSPYKPQFDRKTFLTAAPGFEVWLDWYEPIVDGKAPWGLPRDIANKLEERIALGDGRGEGGKDFWERDAVEVNAEIKGWVEAARAEVVASETARKPVFLSYSNHDLKEAKLIGGIIEQTGMTVFAQYKDMPRGSNFVTEMQSGLANMGKFSPLYSPHYIASEVCQDEWNTAYNMDRGGHKRLIIGFLLKPTDLLPLQKQISYTPLYGLNEFEMREAIREALGDAHQRLTPAASRSAAAKYAAPDVLFENGKLDVVRGETERAMIDDELTRLPETLRQTLKRLNDALAKGNTPPILLSSITDYWDELLNKGATANLPELQRLMEIIQAEIALGKRDGVTWVEGGIGALLKHLFEQHEKLRQHFPLIMRRDQIIQRSEIPLLPENEDKFLKAHNEFAKATNNAAEDDKVSAELNRLVQRRDRQLNDLQNLAELAVEQPDNFIIPGNERVSIGDIKKRAHFDISGTLDKTASVVTIADSASIRSVVSLAKEATKWLWGG